MTPGNALRTSCALKGHDITAQGNALGMLVILNSFFRAWARHAWRAVPRRAEHRGDRQSLCATWAALLEIGAHNRTADETIAVVGLPALGTGFGGVPFDEAARQMAAAYRHYREPPHRLDWDFVVERHKAVCYDAGR
jgi:O-acetyl-ADP-ribose deacetylase (regulator of RNase III)